MGDVTNLTVEILAQIRDELVGLREEVRTRLSSLDTRLSNLENLVTDMNARLRMVEAALLQTNTRLDNLVELSGKAWRDLERRVRKPEKHVGLS